MAFLLFEIMIAAPYKPIKPANKLQKPREKPAKTYASKQYTHTHKNRGAPEDEKRPTTQTR